MAVRGYNRWPEVGAAMHNALRRAVKTTAEDIRDTAQDNAPVDTGFLQKSIYATGAGIRSTYGGGVQKAQRARSKKVGIGSVALRRKRAYQARATRQATQEAMLFPELAPPPDDTSALVAVSATYGIYLEFGTRHMPAQPFWTPAVEQGRATFDAELAGIEGEIKGAVG
jgi:HK97 gp10 family phage protein